MYSKYALLLLWIKLEVLISTTKADIAIYDGIGRFTQELKLNQTITMFGEAGCNSEGTLLAKGVCINDDYDRNRPPKNVTTIDFLIYGLEFLKIREKEKRIQIHIRISASWEDNRIKTNIQSSWYNILLGARSSSRRIIELPIWFPEDQLKVDNLVESKNVKPPATNLHIGKYSYYNGTGLALSILYQLTLSCEFDFSDYPLDVQLCQYRLSNGYMPDIKLRLFDSQGILHSDKRKRYGGFDITVTFIDSNPTESAEESYFTINVKMQRILSPFLFQYYVPCIAIVIVSQISFIIPPTSIPGRIGLVTTQFLTLTNIFINAMVRLLNLKCAAVLFTL